MKLSYIILIIIAFPSMCHASDVEIKSRLVCKPYDTGRDYLLKHGYRIDTGYVGGDDPSVRRLDEKTHPEIICGEGYDATCQTGFSRVEVGAKETLFITVD